MGFLNRTDAEIGYNFTKNVNKFELWKKLKNTESAQLNKHHPLTFQSVPGKQNHL